MKNYDIKDLLDREIEDLDEIYDDFDSLEHIGIKRRSGRYKWGSGEHPYQRTSDFISRVQLMKNDGLTENQIAKALFGEKGTTVQLRAKISQAKNERKSIMADRARSLREDGLSLNQIVDQLNKDFAEDPLWKPLKNDSSVRALLDPEKQERRDIARVTADKLKEELKNKPMLDVGKGVNLELGVSADKFKQSLEYLKDEGYEVYEKKIDQVTDPNGNHKTTMVVLCPPDTPYRDIYQRDGDIKSVGDYHSVDGGNTWNKLEYPASISSDRVAINYGDQGGEELDGTIYIRRGVKDLDLGNSHYAQVRILVDGTHYLKGMALYSDDIPEGKDIQFNTNKKSGTPKEDVFKEIKKDDPMNPFGALIKANGQSYYTDTDGTQKLSAINKLKEETDWENMSKTLSSQFLAKQPLKLIKTQLDLTYKDYLDQYDEITKLTNPVVKKKMLEDFADTCDGAVIHMKAASLPGQKTQVLLPIPSLKDDEIYAPNFRHGDTVAMVRYPHAGTFEIPVLKVNNKHADAREILGNATDAVGINPRVAAKLSGADFDGDTAIVFPCNSPNSRVRINATPSLAGLDSFNPKAEYPYREGMTVMSKKNINRQMGIISNLITDMTLRGADTEEIVRAVKHSMVVIDAYKHKLDYTRSYKENGIAELKSKYQRHMEDGELKIGGASTLLSRRKQDVDVDERTGQSFINEDGSVSYKTTGRTYIDKKGNEVVAKSKDKLLNVTKDLHELSSGTAQESLYADYGNAMKALANRARKESLLVDDKLSVDKAAKAEYAHEVASLGDKLKLALLNAPKERIAQSIANNKIKVMIQDNPELKNDKETQKKLRQSAIERARAEVGASSKQTKIKLTQREWDAIQAHALSVTRVREIFDKMDPSELKKWATPRTQTVVSPAKEAKIRAMQNSGYTNQEIADLLGYSVSTVIRHGNQAS